MDNELQLTVETPAPAEPPEVAVAAVEAAPQAEAAPATEAAPEPVTATKEKKMKRILSEKTLANIKKGLEKGTSYSQISKDCGVAVLTVVRYAKLWGLARGEKNGKTNGKAKKAKVAKVAKSVKVARTAPAAKVQQPAGAAFVLSAEQTEYLRWLQMGLQAGYVKTE